MTSHSFVDATNISEKHIASIFMCHWTEDNKTNFHCRTNLRSYAGTFFYWSRVRLWRWKSMHSNADTGERSVECSLWFYFWKFFASRWHLKIFSIRLLVLFPFLFLTHPIVQFQLRWTTGLQDGRHVVSLSVTLLFFCIALGTQHRRALFHLHQENPFPPLHPHN